VGKQGERADIKKGEGEKEVRKVGQGRKGNEKEEGWE